MAPSLASSWSTNYADVVVDPDTKYEITFTLTSNVKFHDGTDWNADAAKVNFDQIMGGNGALGGPKALKGMHDWLGCARMATYLTRPVVAPHCVTLAPGDLRVIVVIRVITRHPNPT